MSTLSVIMLMFIFCICSTDAIDLNTKRQSPAIDSTMQPTIQPTMPPTMEPTIKIPYSSKEATNDIETNDNKSKNKNIFTAGFKDTTLLWYIFGVLLFSLCCIICLFMYYISRADKFIRKIPQKMSSISMMNRNSVQKSKNKKKKRKQKNSKANVEQIELQQIQISNEHDNSTNDDNISERTKNEIKNIIQTQIKDLMENKTKINKTTMNVNEGKVVQYQVVVNINKAVKDYNDDGNDGNDGNNIYTNNNNHLHLPQKQKSYRSSNHPSNNTLLSIPSIPESVYLTKHRNSPRMDEDVFLNKSNHLSVIHSVGNYHKDRNQSQWINALKNANHRQSNIKMVNV